MKDLYNRFFTAILNAIQLIEVVKWNEQPVVTPDYNNRFSTSRRATRTYRRR
jgi:hypothetical protein